MLFNKQRSSARTTSQKSILLHIDPQVPKRKSRRAYTASKTTTRQRKSKRTIIDSQFKENFLKSNLSKQTMTIDGSNNSLKRSTFNFKTTKFKLNLMSKRRTAMVTSLTNLADLKPGPRSARKTVIGRKNAILKTKNDARNLKLIFEANILSDKMSKTKREMISDEQRIRTHSQFNFKLKEKYIKTMKRLQEHKLNDIGKKYQKYKEMIEKKKIFGRAGDDMKKQFKSYKDVLQFKEKLLGDKKALKKVAKYYKPSIIF